MKKFFVFVFLVLFAILLSGLYGIIHDQISYTVSPEYFTKFKFQQFGLDGMTLPNRVQAGGTLSIFIASIFQVVVRIKDASR